MESLEKLTKKFIKSQLPSIITLFLFLLVAAFMEIFPIRFMEEIVDGFSNNMLLSALLISLLYWYLCRVIGSVSETFAGRQAARFSSVFSNKIRLELYERIANSQFHIIEQANVSENIGAAIDDANKFGNAIVAPVKYTAQNVFTFIWASYFLIKIDYILYFTCIPLGIIMWLIGDAISKKTLDNQKKKRELESEVTQSYLNLFSGVREIFTLKTARQQKKLLAEKSGNLKKFQFKVQWLASFLASMTNALWPIATVISLGVGGYRVLNHELTIGGAMAFMWYVQWAIHPISQLSFYKNEIQSSRVAYMRIKKLFDLFKGDAVAEINEEQINDIELENISYFYPENNRGVSNISLSLTKGHIYSLVGVTGCGKSTVAKLIMGLYEPREGKIKINGEKWPQMKLLGAKQIKSAYSNPYLFPTNIIDNITLEQSADEKKLEEIMRLLKLEDVPTDEFIISQGEQGLSTGQKQRIGIARLLYNPVDVIILDEAISAIDSDTEKVISENIKEVFSEKIVLSISHRLSTVLATDYCFILTGGKIIEQGDPKQLIKNSDNFKELFADQITGMSK